MSDFDTSGIKAGWGSAETRRTEQTGFGQLLRTVGVVMCYYEAV